MKQKVSDYIAEYIAQWGIRDVFTVTGGGAMHMNDAFGHHPKLHCTYQPVSYTHLTLPTT